jgi:hypothetical protein
MLTMQQSLQQYEQDLEKSQLASEHSYSLQYSLSHPYTNETIKVMTPTN